MVLAVASMTAFAQTEVTINQNYVLDGETGELIQVVKPANNVPEQQVQYVDIPQNKQVVVVERQSPVVKAADVVSQAVITGVLVQSLVHKLKHHHHHHPYRHRHYCPPPRHHHKPYGRTHRR